MPNRIVREGILTSARVNLLSDREEVFYRRVLSVVDDYGRYFALPGLLIAACYPLRIKTMSERTIDAMLRACSAAKLLALYEVKGARYLEVIDFGQQVRAKKSKFPERNGAEPSQDQPKEQSPEKTEQQHGRRRELPPDWMPSDETVLRLAEEFKLTNGDAERYLQAFRDACAAKAYKYADFDAAFSNCVRADWPKFRNGAATMPAPANKGLPIG